MQRLHVYQSLWAMEQRIPGLEEPPPEQHFARIAAAGYHGVCLDPAVHEIDANLALAPLFARHGLECMVNAFPHTVEELRPLLAMARELRATQVNVIGGVMPLRASEAVPVIRAWLDMAREHDFPVLLETHRNGTLNDLYFTLEVLEQVPELRLCADLSHVVVDREFHLPLPAQQALYISEVLARSDSFQGRVSSNEQVQVAIGFPQHRPWVEQFRAWWAQGIRAWRTRSPDDATLRFLVELGPPPYAITDASGRELSDRWAEGLTIRRWVEEIWEASADAAPGAQR